MVKYRLTEISKWRKQFDSVGGWVFEWSRPLNRIPEIFKLATTKPLWTLTSEEGSACDV